MFRRPQFSLRTLVIVQAILCAYFAAWESTKRQAAKEYERMWDLDQLTTFLFSGRTYPALPLIMRLDEADLDQFPMGAGIAPTTSRYFVILCGTKFQFNEHPYRNSSHLGPASLRAGPDEF